MKRSPLLLSLALCGALTTGTALADWTYSSSTKTGACAPLDSTGTASDFEITSIVNNQKDTISQTIKMAFVMPSDTSTRPDIIFVQRTGAIKYYTALTGVVKLIGTLPTDSLSTGVEDGLIGVAVESPFKNRVYVSYAFKTTANPANSVINGAFRVARYDMNATTKMLDMASAKVIIDVPSARSRWHTAGGMAFDGAGNLYYAIADNETVFSGPGNTHDLRGSIIRIKPKDAGGYEIPAGNFGEYWANQFTKAGRTTLAATYRDTAKVKAELFVKGLRNPYVINVEPVTKELSWSQCGPDYGGNSEEHSNTKTPIFEGWPFWAGSTLVQSSILGSGQYGKNGTGEPTGANATTFASWYDTSRTVPINRWTGTMAGTPGPGADTLPPITRAKYFYARSCAMGSLIWHYDGKVKNPSKFPPQMDKVWLTGDYNTFVIKAAKVDTAGNIQGAMSARFLPAAFSQSSSAAGIQAITDMKQGPDGSLYINKYTCGAPSAAGQTPGVCGGIVRIDYKGAACADTALHPATSIAKGRLVPSSRVDWLHVGVNSFSVLANGPHSIRVSDVNGRTVLSLKGEGYKDYQLPATIKSGYYYLQVTTEQRGSTVSAITRY